MRDLEFGQNVKLYRAMLTIDWNGESFEYRMRELRARKIGEKFIFFDFFSLNTFFP